MRLPGNNLERSFMVVKTKMIIGGKVMKFRMGVVRILLRRVKFA